ncbi:hypothetical protein SAMN05216355_10464 [Actinomyces ruminicola]|uniref:FHA domain-containing protein n=1 Tax=Actinomyces ruminicola TaxID=332524 RepID=A0A1H0BIJ7_9ACTO|nr:FHA domain-containing protein [Actinomyces ruminicola]SDN45469.1 hypothetical protein SAMN05216355_10464 [Actinomyces ruminicola]
MSQFAIVGQPQAEPPSVDRPQSDRGEGRPLDLAESAVAALVDLLLVVVPAALTHLLLDWTVLAWIVAGEIVVVLALLLAAVGRTPGLAVVSAATAASLTGTTPPVGRSLLRVVLTPLLPFGRRTPGATGAVAGRESLLDSLTRTTTRTSRPWRHTPAQLGDISGQSTPTALAASGHAMTAAPSVPAAPTLSAAPAATAYGLQPVSTGAATPPPTTPPAPGAFSAPAPAAYTQPPYSAAAEPPSSSRPATPQLHPIPASPAPPPPAEELPQSFPPGAVTAPQEPAASPALAPADTGRIPAPPLPTIVVPGDDAVGTASTHTPPLYRIVIDSTRRLPLEGQCVLGRAPQRLAAADVQLVELDASTAVSRSHLRIGVAGAGAWAEDLGSANGSVLVRANGTRTPLEPGVRTPLGPGGVVVLAEGVTVAVEASRRARRAQAR